MVYNNELEKIIVNVPEKIKEEKTNIEIPIDREPAVFTSPDIAPLDVYEDNTTSEVIREDQEAINAIDQKTEEVNEAIEVVSKVNDLVEKNKDKKEVTDEEVNVVAEEFNAIIASLPAFDNSGSECLSISLEDDLPAIGKLGMVLGTIKRWIMTAIRFIRDRLKDIYKFAAKILKDSDRIIYSIKKYYLNAERTLDRFLNENKQLADIEVEWSTVSDKVDFDLFPVCKYTGLMLENQKVVSGMYDRTLSGDYLTSYLMVLYNGFKTAGDDVNLEETGRADVFATMKASLYGLIDQFIDQLKDDEGYRTFAKDYKIKAEKWIPIGFSNTKFVTLELYQKKDPIDDVIKIGDYTLDVNEKELKSKPYFDKISLAKVKYITSILGGTVKQIEQAVGYIRSQYNLVNQSFEFVIERLEKANSNTNDQYVAESIRDTLLTVNRVYKPLIHVAPYKWINHSLKFAYFIGKFYLSLAETVHREVSARVHAENAIAEYEALADHFKVQNATSINGN